MLRRLVPKTIFGPKLLIIIDALAVSIDRAIDYFFESLREFSPQTAVDSLAEWYTELGINYNATQTLEIRRTLATQALRVDLGQSLVELNDVVHLSFPNVTLEAVRVSPTQMAGVAQAGRAMAQDYPSWYLADAQRDGSYPSAYYRVTGEVDSAAARSSLLSLLNRIGPAEMEPVIGGLTIRNQTATAQAGLGMSGLMKAGRN